MLIFKVDLAYSLICGEPYDLWKGRFGINMFLYKHSFLFAC